MTTAPAEMITVNFFSSEKHTRPVVKALEKAKNIELLSVYKNLTFGQNLVSRFTRKKNLTFGQNLVSRFTRKKNLNSLQPADVFIVADFGHIIPEKILAIPKHGSLCLHPSLLPQYRGASPVQYAIMNGEKETGITIFKMDERIDHGPIITQFKDEIRNDDTAGTLYERLFTAAAQVLVTILPSWVEGRIKTHVQDHSKATYTPLLKKEDGRINWQKSDEEIERFIRAMHPWPGAWTEIELRDKKSEVRRLKVLKAHLENNQLILDEVQLEGKKPISWQQFLAGHPTYRFS